jgi:hypothetical protein
LGRCLAHRSLADQRTLVRDHLDELRRHTVGRPKSEFLVQVAENVDVTGIGGGQMHGLGNNRVKYFLDIQSRVDGLADLAQCPQLFHRSR